MDKKGALAFLFQQTIQNRGDAYTYKDGKSWDASKKYKLAIVCSSSKDGDKFSGAPGSVLYVDDLKVSF